MGFACCGPPANVTVARPSAASLASNPMRRATGHVVRLRRVLSRVFKGVSGVLIDFSARIFDLCVRVVVSRYFLQMAAGRIERVILSLQSAPIKPPSSELTISMANARNRWRSGSHLFSLLPFLGNGLEPAPHTRAAAATSAAGREITRSLRHSVRTRHRRRLRRPPEFLCATFLDPELPGECTVCSSVARNQPPRGTRRWPPTSRRKSHDRRNPDTMLLEPIL